MSFSSTMLILSMCLFFFVTLFTLEGFSDDGMEGIKLRAHSITGTLICAILTLILFFVFKTF
ncbi:MAG: hypothetical protein EOM50_02805 [Erysipelotrichia bacterium]|nr:hypothetical protein [Erysipelotrichia bacterium]NCC54015.1 hypothetical protein [Erysipelotrichia bacterium]